jgi:hypothetical protein
VAGGGVGLSVSVWFWHWLIVAFAEQTGSTSIESTPHDPFMIHPSSNVKYGVPT